MPDRRIVEDPFEEPPRDSFQPRPHFAPNDPAPLYEPAEQNPAEEKPVEESVIVPPEALSADTLAALIEEFVTRHGTDLADAEDKVSQVRALLKNGKVQIVFDPNTESCNLLPVK